MVAIVGFASYVYLAFWTHLNLNTRTIVDIVTLLHLEPMHQYKNLEKIKKKYESLIFIAPVV